MNFHLVQFFLNFLKTVLYCICINKKYKASKSKDTEFEDEETRVVPDNSKFNTPSRFVPTNIPTRKMYILPGMP